jgi:excinuclease ABC subunit C
MKKESFKKLKIPDKSGVYFFKRDKEILYIGKATSLRDRVKSYFGKDLIETRGPLLVDMVWKADKIGYQVTDSVLEALILEANLIKKYQPYHNTKEKDDKSFNYVVITKEKLPKVLVVRGKNVQHSVLNKTYGPYTSGSQLREAMKIIRKIFPFLDEKSKNYLEFYKQIKLAPDLNNRKLYLQNIKNIKLFFSGKKKKIFQNLKKEMKTYAKNHEFEKAGEIKRQIFALQHINDIALLKNMSSVFPPLLVEEGVGGGDSKKNHFALKGTPPQKGGEGSSFRIEAYDIAHLGGKNMVGVMTVVEDGEMAKNEYRKFKIKTQKDANDTGALAEVLERRFAHPEWHYPNLVVIDGGTAQINVARKVIINAELSIPVVSVVKDEKHKPKAILGDKEIIKKNKAQILLSNSEAHRFAIVYHKKMRNKNFLK